MSRIAAHALDKVEAALRELVELKGLVSTTLNMVRDFKRDVREQQRTLRDELDNRLARTENRIDEMVGRGDHGLGERLVDLIASSEERIRSHALESSARLERSANERLALIEAQSGKYINDHLRDQAAEIEGKVYERLARQLERRAEKPALTQRERGNEESL